MHLLDITKIDNFVHKEPKNDKEAYQILIAEKTGFSLHTHKDEYYWEASSATEKNFFLLSLVRIYEKYIDQMDDALKPNVRPLLLGFGDEELKEIGSFRHFIVHEHVV